MPEEPYPEQKSGAGDQKAPRTLDEQQVEGQDISGPEEQDLGHAPLWFEQEAPPTYLARDEEVVAEQDRQATLASRPEREDLPYEGLITAGELIMCAIAFSATLWLTWWTFEYLSDLLYPVEMLADYRLLISFIISGVMTALIWLAKRAKRLNKAKHLRGALRT